MMICWQILIMCSGIFVHLTSNASPSCCFFLIHCGSCNDWIAHAWGRKTWTKCICIFIVDVFPSFEILNFQPCHLVLSLSHNISKMTTNQKKDRTVKLEKKKSVEQTKFEFGHIVVNNNINTVLNSNMELRHLCRAREGHP